jgi:hypothetical protein
VRLWFVAAHTIDYVHCQMETIYLIQNCHIERRRSGSFLFAAADVQIVMVGSTIGEAVNQPWVAMKGKHVGLSAVRSESKSRSDRPCGCSEHGCNVIRSTTLTTRIRNSG